VCHDVEKEPPLWPLTGEQTEPLSANTYNDARADIKARGFWGQLQRQCAYIFDVRVSYIFLCKGIPPKWTKI